MTKMTENRRFKRIKNKKKLKGKLHTHTHTKYENIQ